MVTEDTQEEDTVPKVMLLVAVVVDSSARSLTILLKEVKSSCVLVPVEELVTDKVVLAAVKPAEKAVVTAVTLVPNLQEAQVLLVLMDHNLLEETATLVDSKTPDPMTVLVEVLDTSVVKVVVTTLEAAAVAGFFCRRALAAAEAAGPVRDKLVSEGQLDTLHSLSIPMARVLARMQIHFDECQTVTGGEAMEHTWVLACHVLNGQQRATHEGQIECR